MVASVQNTGSTAAYTKSAQLNTTKQRPLPEAELKQEAKETERTQTTRSTDNSSSIVKAAATTEISDKNEQQTIISEQARGSLLDLAV
jgi:hypothetical protein